MQDREEKNDVWIGLTLKVSVVCLYFNCSHRI